MTKNIMTKASTIRIIVTERLKRSSVYFMLIAGSIVFLYPIIYAVAVGFMDKYEFTSTPPTLLPIPSQFTIVNYKKLLGMGDSYMKYYFLNSFVRAGWYVFIMVITSLVAGYVFARLKFWGREVIFFGLLISAMLPYVVTMAPTYIMMARFPLVGGNSIFGQGGTGFIDTYPVLLILGLVNVLGIFLMRMAMYSLPIDFEEAARIDGAGTLRIIFQIVAPIQKPILAYIAITTGIMLWNDWFTPFIYVNTNRYLPLAAAISKLTALAVGQHGLPDWPRIITLGLGLTLPCLILFAYFQRYIVEGLASAAIKG